LVYSNTVRFVRSAQRCRAGSGKSIVLPGANACPPRDQLLRAPHRDTREYIRTGGDHWAHRSPEFSEPDLQAYAISGARLPGRTGNRVCESETAVAACRAPLTSAMSRVLMIRSGDILRRFTKKIADSRPSRHVPIAGKAPHACHSNPTSFLHRAGARRQEV